MGYGYAAAWAKLRTTVGWDHISDYTRQIMTSGTPNFHVHMVIFQVVDPWWIRTHFPGCR